MHYLSEFGTPLSIAVLGKSIDSWGDNGTSRLHVCVCVKSIKPPARVLRHLDNPVSHCDPKKAKGHVTRPRRSVADPEAIASRGAEPSGVSFGRTSSWMRPMEFRMVAKFTGSHDR